MVELAAAASAIAWLYLLLGRGGFWHVAPLLRPAPLSEVAPRSVVVIIPARDEAETIGNTVRSLLAQSLTVLVVDDSSEDGTGQLARSAGAQVISARPLPPGWTGKLWALSEGVRNARALHPDYYLFTDADIVHEADSVRKLVARAETDGFDLVSCMVRLRCESVAEQCLIPAFVYFFFMLYPPALIASKQRKTAGAAGGCILLRPGALERAGGLEAISHELIDDCALARIVKNTGGSLWLGMTAETRSERSYGSFAEIRRMIARTAFTQLGYSGLMLFGTVAGLLFLYWVPVISALRGSWFGALALFLMVITYAPMARFYGRPVLTGLLLPLTSLFYLYATVDSAFRYWTGAGGEWKGRAQAVSRIR